MMGHTIRNVPLKLGLISVMVGVQTAIEDSTPKTNTICDQGHAPVRVKQSLACPTCNNDDRSSFKKGLLQPDGTVAMATADEVAGAAQVAADVKDAITLTTHPSKDLAGTTVPGGKLYYLSPGKAQDNHYALIVELVRKRDDIAFMAAFALKGKPALYRVQVLGDALTLVEHAWPESLRAAPEHEGVVDQALLAAAEAFVDSLIAPYDPNNYRDTRAEQLNEFFAKQQPVESGETPVETATSGNDLLSALEAAVSQSKPAAKKAKKVAKKATTRKAS